jgi:glycosyltransferase involved in cell wall biosynthesis
LRVLFVVTEDWYFLSHRLPMAIAARDAGFDVHVATRVVDGQKAIEAHGFTVHPVPFVRGALAPLASICSITILRRLQNELAPEVTHHVSLQASILGSLAALGCPGARVNALTGFGYLFVSNSVFWRAARGAISGLLRFLVNRPKNVALVQNPDDRDGLARIGVDPRRLRLIAGSGVDVDRLRPQAEPSGPPTIAFVGRLLDDKGIRTLMAAHRLLRGRGVEVELLIAGTPDPANPATVREEEASAWNREPGVRCLGHVTDIAGLWAKAHIAVLPSRREGLPKSLLEAAACERALIATDVPGCREIVRNGETGLLVPVDDAPALADAIEALASDPQTRKRFAAAARKLAVTHFSSAVVGRQTVDLYRSLVDGDGR